MIKIQNLLYNPKSKTEIAPLVKLPQCTLYYIIKLPIQKYTIKHILCYNTYLYAVGYWRVYVVYPDPYFWIYAYTFNTISLLWVYARFQFSISHFSHITKQKLKLIIIIYKLIR